jgi:site-specific DNA recombinase
MICAVYARKSTEQQVADDAKSVTRQLQLARTFARSHEWEVLDEYVDDGVSGALATKLTGRARMLAAATAEKFSVLIVRDVDRLSRNDEELPGIIYSLRDAGVEVWSYAEGARVDTRTAMSRGMLTMRATFAAAEREAGQQRTQEAMRSKAARGHVAGGTVFGYRNVRAADGHVEREILEAEAVILRRIFAMTAAGVGYQRIARQLNAEAVPAPVPRRPGRPRGWAPSTIRAMLFNDLYRGRVLYGRTRWEYRRGRKFKIAVPESEWITREAPALRIVDEAVWSAAHERLASTRAAYVHLRNGQAGGRPVNGAEGRYLLTGVGQCGICAGGMFVHTRGPWHRGAPTYGCMTYHTRGRVVCANNLEVALADAERAVLSAVEHQLLRVEVLETGLYKALTALTTLEAPETAGPALRAELARLEAEVGRLAAAIAAGGPLESLVGLLQERERRRAQVRAALAELERQHHTQRRGAGDTLAVMRKALTDWQAMLRQEGPQARPALSALLTGRLTFTPRGEGRARYYAFAGPGSLDKVIAGLALPMELVPPG